MTSELGRHIAALSDPVTEAELQTVRQDLLRIMELNMAAIRAKSSAVEERADYVMWWLIVVAALCVVSAGAILVWFPRLVLRPIDELKKGIREIANHNYQQRLDFTGNREFESVAESFNDMAAKLDEYRRSSLDDLMTAKKRIEAIVDTLHEPIIGLGPDRKILFMNREALAVLNLQAEVVGRNAAEVALSNDLLRRLMRELYGEKRSTGGEPLKIYADNKESYFQMENTPLYITPVGGREQQFVGNLIILSNVTKYKELDSAKTNFISTVSHEMKTPISSILMSLQLLGDDRLGKLNDEQKQLVGEYPRQQRPSSLDHGRIAQHDADRDRQAQTHAQDHQADRTDRLRRQGDAGIGRAVLLFRRGGIPRKNLETVRRQRKDRVGHHQPAVERHPPLARKNRASSWAPYSTKRRSKSTCGISDGASTRVTTRAFSNAISAYRAPRYRAADWGWPSPRSSSRRTAARSASKARSARAAASRFCCPCEFRTHVPRTDSTLRAFGRCRNRYNSVLRIRRNFLCVASRKGANM